MRAEDGKLVKGFERVRERERERGRTRRGTYISHCTIWYSNVYGVYIPCKSIGPSHLPARSLPPASLSPSLCGGGDGDGDGDGDGGGGGGGGGGGDSLAINMGLNANTMPLLY
jgi:hypothetical protein